MIKQEYQETMCDKPYTSSDKWTVSIVSGLMFMLASSPYTFSLTNGITSKLGLVIADANGCPNLAGVLLHGIAFVFIIRMLMDSKAKTHDCMKPYTSKDKWIVALIAGLLFLLFSSPFLYETVNSLTSSFGLNIVDGKKGCPNLGGLVLNSTLYLLATRMLMR